MKLYYAPGACSLAPHIVAAEGGVPVDLVKVDVRAKKLEDGSDYLQVNPKGAVPALGLDEGGVLTENAVVMQYIAERAPGSGLVPAGGLERWRLLELLNYVATEVHKGFGPLWNPASAPEVREGAIATPDRQLGLRVIDPAHRSSNVSGTSLVGANLERSKLSGVVAMRADFSDAVLKNAKMIRAHLKQASFANAVMAGCDLSGADLSGANLRNAVLVGAKTTMADLTDADLTGALTDKPLGVDVQSLPYEAMLKGHAQWCETAGVEGAPAVFDGADLRSLESIKGYNLTALSAKGAIFYGLDMGGVQLQGAHLEGADLRNCNLRRADLRGARLNNAQLMGADLREAQLGPLLIFEDRLLPANLSGACLRYADLSGADMRRVILEGADLEKANLSGALLGPDAARS